MTTLIFKSFLPISAFVLSAVGATPEFEFKDGKCRNAKGIEGRNPGFVGDCGDLRGMDFTGKNLSGVSLRGADFTGNLMNQVNLSRAKLDSAVLNGVSLVLANLSAANLNNAQAKRADLSQANLSNAVLFQVDLSGSQMKSSRGARADFSYAKLSGCKLDLASFTEASFLQADMTFTQGVGPDFTLSRFEGSDFSGAILNQPIFSSAEFVDTRLVGVRFPDAALGGSIIHNCDLTRSVFDRSLFRTARIENSVLTNASFKECRFNGANLQMDGWKGVLLAGAQIDGLTIHPFSQAEIMAAGILVSKHNNKVGVFYDPGIVETVRANPFLRFLDTEEITRIETYDAVKIQNTLKTVGTFFIPPTRVPYPASDEMLSVYETYVKEGGNIIFAAVPVETANKIFKTSIKAVFGSFTHNLNPVGATGMGLGKLPNTLYSTNSTHHYPLSSLPPTSVPLFADSMNASVVMIPYGRGSYWLYGWDLYGYSDEVPVRVDWKTIFQAMIKNWSP